LARKLLSRVLKEDFDNHSHFPGGDAADWYCVGPFSEFGGIRLPNLPQPFVVEEGEEWVVGDDRGALPAKWFSPKLNKEAAVSARMGLQGTTKSVGGSL
jgi:hypothetical protein